MNPRRSASSLTAWVLCSCGSRFQRPSGATYVTCLTCETTERLREAGIRWDDPAFAFLAAMNETARRKAGFTDAPRQAA